LPGYNVDINDVREYTVDMPSDGMIFIPSLMTNGSSIQLISRVLPQEFERL
jgi:hypothetical protein